jgi:hypothetical protein
LPDTRPEEPERFERAAARWLARLLVERLVTELRDVERIVVCVATLPDTRRGQAALELLKALAAHGAGRSAPSLR